MWLGWGRELGEVKFQRILWVGRPLLSSLMTSQLCWCCVCTLAVERAQYRNNRYCHHFFPGENLALALILTTQYHPVSPCCSLPPTPHRSSQPGTGAQREQVRHHESPLTDAAPLRGVSTCHCYGLCPTQPLGTGQPHIFTPS